MPQPLDLENGRLPQDLVERYWQDGFLFPVPVLTPEDAARARAELEDLERDWLDAGLPLPLNTYKRVNAHVVIPLAARLATHPAVLDVVEGLLGPDILVYAAEFFIKEARSRQIVTMHQDLTYWGLGATQNVVTAWIALSPSTPESGCMDFVRGSHKNPILPHEDSNDPDNLLSRGQEVKVDVDPADRVPIEIHPGQMSLHHGLTIHGSGPNRSHDRRIALVVRYCTPDVAQEMGETDFAMPARGTDRFGHFTHIAPPSTVFGPEEIALYEHIRRVQGKVKMAGSTADPATSMFTGG